MNNRQRRKAKKQKQQPRSGYRPAGAGVPYGRQRSAYRPGKRSQWWSGEAGAPGSSPPGGPVDEVAMAREGVLLAAHAFLADPDGEYHLILDALRSIQAVAPPRLVDGAVTWALRSCFDIAWANGWQPGDLVRYVRRLLTAKHAAAVAPLVAASGGARPEAAGDDRWAAQVAAIAEDAPGDADFDPASGGMAFGIEVVASLQGLPILPRLSSSAPTARGPSSVAMLARVRALLAKAESTTFPEEAEALTAKAQELMARHAIDAAMIDAANRAAGPSAIVGWRIAVDDPYAGAKSILLDCIADANRCRAVWSKGLGFSTVFGDTSDLEMVELLFTSLLVQGTDAMLRSGRSTDRYGTSRTRSFRQSFLVAYASRIGERLASAAESAVAEGRERHGDALLPVLASRAEEVHRIMEETFPELVSQSTAINNYSGWVAGRAAADLASLEVAQALPF